MYYTLKDHQGSLTATIRGNTVERLSYDPWGRRRNTTNFGYDNVNYTFDRGYTLHEHYDEFDLINMNGRMYDPVMSSFLSADRYVQDPTSSQGFNRYAYCMYNPLRFVDPTGWLMGPPKSKSGLIQEYLSDPCRTTREQLREAGIYNIEGSYGFYGGGGNILAGWMEGDGSIHYSSWSVQTEGTGFEVGAWAIPSSFNPMWVNDCQGFCDYGAANIDHVGTGASSIASYYTLGANNGGSRGANQGINIAATVLTTMWTANVVEPTPIGEAISLVATGAAAIYYSEELIAKMKAEIAHLQTRPDGPDGFVYELRANTDGLYPSVRTSTLVYLEAGDIWKIGETTQLEGGRYTR